MSLQVEPYQLRFLASRLSAGAQEIRMRANRLENIMNELVQGSWKGKGAHAFAVKCEVMKGEMQKTSDVLDSVVQTLNRFANQMERVNQLRQQANMLEQQSWQYSGDSVDDLHERQILARQAAQIRQEAEWEANAADAQTANEFQMIVAMIPQLMEQMGQYMGSNGNADKLDDLPEPLRSYYLRHKDLLHDDEFETAATLTMGSYKQADYDGVKQYEQDHESENETWYEKTWDWLKGEGREFVVDYKQHWTTGNIWYDEANYWLLGIPDNVKRVFHTKPFSLENWEANLELFVSVVPPLKIESIAGKGVSKAVESGVESEIAAKEAMSATDELAEFAEKNNVKDLAWSYDQVLKMSAGDMELARRLVLSTKEIQEGKSIVELVQTFHLTDNPAPHSLSNYQTRIWYLWQESKIASKLDYSQPLEQVARQAFELRNMIRTQARVSMSDQLWADHLMKYESNYTFDDLVKIKMDNKGLSGDDLWRDMIRSSMSSRDTVDSLYKLK